MKIYRISITLAKDGYREKCFEFDCEETKKGYKVDRESSFGGKTTLVKKSQILTPDSLIKDEIIYRIHRHTWYLSVAETDKARQICTDSIIQKVKENYATANELFSIINKPHLNF